MRIINPPSPAPLTGALSLRLLSSRIRCRALRPCSSFSWMIDSALDDGAFAVRTGLKPEDIIAKPGRTRESRLRLRSLTGVAGLSGVGGGEEGDDDEAKGELGETSAIPDGLAREPSSGKLCDRLRRLRLVAVKSR